MRKKFLIVALLLSSFVNIAAFAQAPADSLMIRKIYDEALSHGAGYTWLRYLSEEIGGRLSGSPQAAAAVEWSRQVMDSLGLDSVYLQQVMVPHWMRGKKEVGKIISAGHLATKEVGLCALGGSVATPKNGITAAVVEVQNFQELRSLGRNTVAGKIVFFNRPMDPTLINTFSAYAGAVNQRGAGVVEAAKLGAVAVIVRSMSLFSEDYAHTGGLRYAPDVREIPGAAISTNHADMLSSLLKREPDTRFFLEMHCRNLPEVISYNVIGELRGTTNPEEIIAIGGHLDSWDIGDGAHDDGAGCVQSIEVLRIFQQLKIKPKRTIRVVMFMNEENGLRGGLQYALKAKENQENHIVAIESDAGGFSPRGFGIDASDDKIRRIKEWKPLFLPYGIYQIGKGGGGADISPLRDEKIALIGLMPDSQRYFTLHHAETDTFDKVNKRELELGAAAMTSLVYLFSIHGL